MKRKICKKRAALLSILALLSGCRGSVVSYDYTHRGTGSLQSRTNSVVVQIRVTRASEPPNPPMSFTTPFSVEGEVISGKVPKHPGARKVRLRVYHGWTDVLVKKGSVLTLNVAPDGTLVGIKEFTLTGIGGQLIKGPTNQ